jgi:hypothetical protein
MALTFLPRKAFSIAASSGDPGAAAGGALMACLILSLRSMTHLEYCS